MKKVCSWCVCHGRKAMVLAEGPEAGPVSHGICRRCAREFMEDDAANGFTQLVTRVLQQFVAVPGMLVSVSQVQRLLDVDAATCLKVLQCLVDAEFVQPVGLDTYARNSHA
jgi:superfamily II helicase